MKEIFRVGIYFPVRVLQCWVFEEAQTTATLSFLRPSLRAVNGAGMIMGANVGALKGSGMLWHF